MIKYLFIVINSLAVFLYSLFSGDNGVTVTGTFPPTLKAGQEAAIELKINKGSMGGFAKFQLELPEGLAAKEAENKGANYTYSNGVAKWVWASLPAENEITIKITLISSDEATGAKMIQGKFSFVENNAKQVVEMTPAEITITSGPGSDNAASATTPSATPAPDTVAVPPAAIQNSATASNNEPPGNINLGRTITKGSSDNEFIVSLRIKKGATRGFARYSDDLPEGLTVKASKTEGSSFSVGDGKLKFVWVSVPEKEELELEYTISGNSNTPVTLNGEYSYLEDNQSKKVKLSPEMISLPAVGQPVATTPKEEKTETRINETVVAENSSAATQAKMEQTLSKKEGQVDYHVQIGAFTNANVDAGKLKRVFKVKETISSEMQGGFSKFMVGSHGEYKGARDHREEMKNSNGIKSAFVVAYNGSKRITVQEALMMTNQKWFK